MARRSSLGGVIVRSLMAKPPGNRKRTSAGPTYYIDVEHPGLGRSRRITGKNEYVVQMKAVEQLRVWDNM